MNRAETAKNLAKTAMNCGPMKTNGGATKWTMQVKMMICMR